VHSQRLEHFPKLATSDPDPHDRGAFDRFVKAERAVHALAQSKLEGAGYDGMRRAVEMDHGRQAEVFRPFRHGQVYLIDTRHWEHARQQPSYAEAVPPHGDVVQLQAIVPKSIQTRALEQPDTLRPSVEDALRATTDGRGRLEDVVIRKQPHAWLVDARARVAGESRSVDELGRRFRENLERVGEALDRLDNLTHVRGIAPLELTRYHRAVGHDAVRQAIKETCDDHGIRVEGFQHVNVESICLRDGTERAMYEASFSTDAAARTKLSDPALQADIDVRLRDVSRQLRPTREPAR